MSAFITVKGAPPEMPQTCGLEHLIEHMLMAGPGLPGPMGLVPLDFKEIDAYDKLDMLSVTDRKAIRDLSRVYISQLNISSEKDCPAPWVKGVEDIEAHNFNLKMQEAKTLNIIKKPLNKKR